MVPFTQQQLATVEDYKYRGYIPVNHSIFTQDNTFSGTVKVEENVADLHDVPKIYIDEVEEKEWNTQPPKLQNVIRNQLTPQFGPVIVPGTDFVKKAPALNHIFYEPPVEIIEPIARPPVRAAPKGLVPPPIAYPYVPNFNSVRPRP